MRLPRVKDGDPIPDDFWNYDINIILGYRYRNEPRDCEQETTKYGLN